MYVYINNFTYNETVESRSKIKHHKLIIKTMFNLCEGSICNRLEKKNEIEICTVVIYISSLLISLISECVFYGWISPWS